MIKIENASGDLEKTDIFWASDTYVNKLQDINNCFKEKTGGFPSANMQPIRKITISVGVDTKMFMLQIFAKDLKNNFGIDCFQISLDKDSHTAIFLFDWYDRDNGCSRYIYKTLQKKIEVMAMHQLGLSCKSKNDELLRLYLKNQYRQNKDIYKNLLEKVGNAKMGKGSYQLLEIIINYVELVCQGKVK